MIHHQVEQNTEEWLDLRAGHLTGSSVSLIMANEGKAFGDPAKKLATNIAIEQVTGQPILSSYSNMAMEKGHEYEPLARQAYEARHFVDVDPGGFFDCGFEGCSPDGLVGSAGLIEIKSAIVPHIHFERIRLGRIETGYRWQCIFNLVHTCREWIDFVSFCPDFPAGGALWEQRLVKDDLQEEIERMFFRVAEFQGLVDRNVAIIKENTWRAS